MCVLQRLNSTALNYLKRVGFQPYPELAGVARGVVITPLPEPSCNNGPLAALPVVMVPL